MKDFLKTIVEADKAARKRVENAKQAAYSESGELEKEKSELAAKYTERYENELKAETQRLSRLVESTRLESEKRVENAKANAEKFIKENMESAADEIFNKIVTP